MRLLAFLLLFSFMSCATIEKQDNLQTALAHFKIGVAYYNENKIQQAFVEFQKAYELNPKDKEVLNAIGIIYLMHFDEIPKSIVYFEKAVSVDPHYSEAYNNLGFAYEKSGNFDTAISYYKKAVSNLVYPTPEKAYINMGISYYRLRKYDLAIESLKEAIKRAPNLDLPYFKLALCYNALGKYGEASAAMTQAINLDPVYKGDRGKAVEDLKLRKLNATGYDEQDIRDYLEILKY
ncbi:MAG: tetratricopeptide repeat protein [Nitrospirota bacterium]